MTFQDDVTNVAGSLAAIQTDLESVTNNVTTQDTALQAALVAILAANPSLNGDPNVQAASNTADALTQAVKDLQTASGALYTQTTVLTALGAGGEDASRLSQ